MNLLNIDTNSQKSIPGSSNRAFAAPLNRTNNQRGSGQAKNIRASALQEHATQTSTTDASTITSSDFLTLFVSELQNQDPTEPTDPNSYITQLVGVNSLQQLIAIDQGISSLEPTATTSVSEK